MRIKCLNNRFKSMRLLGSVYIQPLLILQDLLYDVTLNHIKIILQIKVMLYNNNSKILTTIRCILCIFVLILTKTNCG